MFRVVRAKTALYVYRKSFISMNEEQHLNYARMAKAIAFLQENFKKQPSLDELAKVLDLSPAHVQRLFTTWAGVSPKKFIQYISLEHAKQVLKGKQATLFDAAEETGLSGTGRLHDLFVSIEGMTPGEYKNGGEGLVIHYHHGETPFGKILIASTPKGICHVAFIESEHTGIERLQHDFPNASFKEQRDPFHSQVLDLFMPKNTPHKIRLHVKGTAFQLKVWSALLKIPMGKLSTYGKLAEEIGNPMASRAVGTAIGSNPIAFIIPCHRVIQSTGAVGGYMWGTTRKSAIIGWEAAKTS
jgi:AraC family transcriptional regulator, regulatory protein of adaptative response / methylated-DNA-[protein]-cysteine methyltransferase